MSSRTLSKPSVSKSRKRAASIVPDSEPSDSEPSHTPRKKHKRVVSPELIERDDRESELYEDEPTVVGRESSLAATWDPPRYSSPGREFEVPGEPRFYEGEEDEVFEDEDLQVIGETDPADISDSDDESPTVPVRQLHDFSIYEAETLRLVPIAILLDHNLGFKDGVTYAASGRVKPWIDNDEWEDEDEEEDEDDEDVSQAELRRIRLTPIRQFTVHDLKKQTRKLDRQDLGS
ncbi:hypothetical protein BV22DRAFT_1130613 [Leucogyrophana mollusca]|uniref:Uncharacterized protein n=1 Tax=Leucogyrophana mollusca TaxID=85980 RepID=A0ACB8BCD5_9AGAM|nr:hypothetical protein BV22DRAFT_1130613 [Leucogyrophana mollusca]